jgi:predicted ATPase/DNA-binding CsgD family transcriptional regulator
MTRHIPTVRNGALYEGTEETASPEAIAVESVAWYTWVERHRSFRFEDTVSTFTARKEQRSGSWYWYAYRRQGGRLRTAYLGRSAELSTTRLEVIAAELAGANGPPNRRTTTGEQAPGTPASPSHKQANVTVPGPAPFHNLPQQLTSLVGREQEVASAAALFRRPEVRLLTMVGTAGVGKTRLAIQVATDLLDDFPDGVWFVALASIRDPELVLSTVAQTLELRVTGDQSFLEVLKAYLCDRHCLLVLDNFEQVVSAASQLPDLLWSCPGLKLLVTSREVLHLRAEHQFSVPPLALPDRKQLPDEQALARVAAIELFLQRAQATRHDFELTHDNAEAIAEICIRLDGLPLAIELAAARINVFAPQALLTRLTHRLHLLTGGARDLPERQQTLRDTLSWSYELLTEQEQCLFRRFSIFVGGCTLEALEAVCDVLDKAFADQVGSVLECVASLIDKSLVQQSTQEGVAGRLLMLETISEYGLEMLTVSGEVEATCKAHATYYLALAEQAEPQLTSPQQLTWFERLEREDDNLRAALSWLLERGTDEQNKEFALRLSGALVRFWAIRGYVREGRRWLERALDENRGMRSAVRAKALTGVGHLIALLDDPAQAEALCGEGLALYRELGDRHGSAAALSSLGFAATMRSNFGQARMLLEEALALLRQVGDTAGSVLALHLLGSVLIYQGEYAQAQARLEESRVLSEAAGDFGNYVNSLSLLGFALLSQGDLAQGHARLEESLTISRKMGYKRSIAFSLHGLAMESTQQGDLSKANSLLEESLRLFQEVGEWARIAEVLVAQGFLSLSQGDFAAARERLEESLQISLELDYKWNTAGSLEGLATVVVAQGEPGRAAWLLSAAQAIREAISSPLHPVIQALHELTMASTRTQLGEQAFAAAWAQGRMMTPDQILTVQEPLAIPATAVAELLPMPHTPKSLANPTGLTAREMEVLRLLAQGLTSAQIVERLVIGQVTVNSHVRSIYSKLGVTSRAAATRYTIEHQLV